MPTITVDPEMGCPNCPFGKPTTNPWTGQIYHACFASLFLGKIEAEHGTDSGKWGTPETCPLKQGPITVELRS